MGANVLERFWSKVDRTKDCWNWTAALDGRGYGKFYLDGFYMIASRVSWELANGLIPKGANVCHKCDNPRCVNPEHLFIGSNKDNMQDMKTKGRHKFRVGSANPNAKLTKQEVWAIKEARHKGVSAKELSQLYGISKGTVYNLCNFKQAKWTGNRGRSREELLGVTQ